MAPRTALVRPVLRRPALDGPGFVGQLEVPLGQAVQVQLHHQLGRLLRPPREQRQHPALEPFLHVADPGRHTSTVPEANVRFRGFPYPLRYPLRPPSTDALRCDFARPPRNSVTSSSRISWMNPWTLPRTICSSVSHRSQSFPTRR